MVRIGVSKYKFEIRSPRGRVTHLERGSLRKCLLIVALRHEDCQCLDILQHFRLAVCSLPDGSVSSLSSLGWGIHPVGD